MSDMARHFLEIAAIVVVCLSVIGIIFTSLGKTTVFTDKAGAKMDSMITVMDESDYVNFDGTIVSGSDVIAAIKKFQNDEICITVTARGTYSYVYTDTSLSTPSTENISNTSKKSDDHFINPNGKFLGAVVRADDGSIVGITFTIQTT